MAVPEAEGYSLQYRKAGGSRWVTQQSAVARVKLKNPCRLPDMNVRSPRTVPTETAPILRFRSLALLDDLVRREHRHPVGIEFFRACERSDVHKVVMSLQGRAPPLENLLTSQ